MYDKITMWIDRVYCDEEHYIQVENILSNPQVLQDLKRGITTLKGGYHDMKVNVYENGIFIVGSLSKCYYGSNCYTLTKSTTKAAIEGISEAFKFSPDKAVISALEFGTMFPMKEQVYKYIKALGEMPNMNRTIFPNMETLYYANKTRTLRFYDKGKEAMKKRSTIPKGLEDANLLRYEIAFNRNVINQLNVLVNKMNKKQGGKTFQRLGKKTLTAQRLYDDDFYCLMKSIYQYQYEEIIKLYEMKTFSLDGAKNFKEAISMILAYAGQSPEVAQAIQEKRFANRTFTKRLKDEMARLADYDFPSVSNQDIINELNECVRDIENHD